MRKRGSLEIEISGVLVVVPTSPGQFAASVAAISADAALVAAGISAQAIDARVVTDGSLDALRIFDEGLSPVPVPGLPWSGLVWLALALAATLGVARFARA